MTELTPERWQQIDDVFHAALDLPRERRAAFLDDMCAGDPELRAEVEALLLADASPSGILDGAAADLAAALLPDDERTLKEDQQIGPYRILRELGRGGMGVVYLAERTDVGKKVALKLVRETLHSAGQFQRFLVERRILARLEHPNIARLLDAGVTDDGAPYFAMEYVEGEQITQYCETRNLSISERLLLFTKVCEATDYAHRNLVIHRDLKPSNILVTTDGEVKLLDFGIAKLLDDEVGEPAEEVLTRTGIRLMTPEYAAPEQVRGETVTTATDVYALGVILYELLAGRRPYEVRGLTASEVERLICETEPPRPSTLAVDDRGSARSRATGMAYPFGTISQRQKLKGDLDAIVLKALRKEPARRYTSAEQLALDIGHYLAGRPVTAGKGTFSYRASKFVRRNRNAIAASTAFAVALIGLATFYTVRLTMERDRAELEAQKAVQVASFLKSLFKTADPLGSMELNMTVQDLLARGAARADSELAGQPEMRGAMLSLIGEVYQNMGRLKESEELLQRALHLRTKAFGQEHVDVAETMKHLGRLRLTQGNLEEAERLLRGALEIYRKHVGTDHQESISCLDLVAQTVHVSGRYEEAERLFREELAINRRLHGEEHAETAANKHNLAGVLHSRGQYAAAEALYRESLATLRRLHGDAHPTVWMSMNALGLMLREQDRPQEAEPYLRETYEQSRAHFGPDHPSVTTFTVNLALTLQDLGNLAEAERLFRDVLASDRKQLGENHPYVAEDMDVLGVLLMDLNRLDEAEPLLRGALPILTGAYGAEHARVATVHSNLGHLLKRRGTLQEAETHLRAAADIRRKALDAGDARLARSLYELGVVLDSLGRSADAIAAYTEALSSYRAGDTPRPGPMADVLTALGRAHLRLKRYAEAETYLLESYRSLEGQESDQDALNAAREALRMLYEAWGRPAEAESFAKTSATRKP